MAENNYQNNPKKICKESVKEVDRNKYPEMEFFMNESASDVVFKVESQRVPAIKSILSFKSQVFRAMFSGNFKESKDKEVVIKDTTFDAFKNLVRFIYSEQLVLTDRQDLDSIKDLVKLSDRYQVFRLIDKIGDILKNEITFENLEFVCGIAFEYNIKELIPKIKEFIEKKFNDIINKDMSEVLKINEYTHNCYTQVLTQYYRKTEKTFRPLTNTKIVDFCGECGYIDPHLTLNGIRVTVPVKFDFDKMHEN